MRKSILLAVLFILGTSHYVLGTRIAEAATLYFHPESIDVVAGGSFLVEVRLDTEGELINAIDITGVALNGLVESVTTANSLVEIFIDASAKDGNKFRFAGGTPNGFTGNGIIGRVGITAASPGEVNLSFDQSTILSGTGEPLTKEVKTRQATAEAFQPGLNHIIVTSRTHPDQNRWYSTKDLHLHWDLEDGVEYSYMVSADPSALPDDIGDKPEGTLLWQGDINIGGLNEGIYYFKLKRVGQDEITRFRAMIDSTAPEWAAFEISDGVPETQYNKFVTFFAKDTLSGINRYEVAVDDEEQTIISPPYILPEDFLKITIFAIDNAGNVTSRIITSDTQKNILLLYIVVGLVVLGAAVVAVKPLKERIFTRKK